MKVLRRLMMFACVSVLLASCGDDSGLTLTLTSPADGTVYTEGDVITVSGTAIDDVEVASVTVEITGLITPQDLGGNGTATVPFTASVELVTGTLAMEDVTILVTATDNDGNTETEERSISIQ